MGVSVSFTYLHYYITFLVLKHNLTIWTLRLHLLYTYIYIYIYIYNFIANHISLPWHCSYLSSNYIRRILESVSLRRSSVPRWSSQTNVILIRMVIMSGFDFCWNSFIPIFIICVVLLLLYFVEMRYISCDCDHSFVGLLLQHLSSKRLCTVLGWNLWFVFLLLSN